MNMTVRRSLLAVAPRWAALVVVGSALVVASSGSVPAMAHYPAKGKPCGWVSQNPGEIGDAGMMTWAYRTSCSAARKLAADYMFRAETGSTLHGVLVKYRCKRRVRQNGDSQSGQAHTDVRCVRGRKVITMAWT